MYFSFLINKRWLFSLDLEFSFSIPGLFQTWNSNKPGFEKLNSRSEPGFEKLNSRSELELSKTTIKTSADIWCLVIGFLSMDYPMERTQFAFFFFLKMELKLKYLLRFSYL